MELVPKQNSEDPKKQEIHRVIEEQTEYKYVNSAKHNPGHKMFSYNRVTCEIKEVLMENKVLLGTDGKPFYKKDLKMEPNCVYGQALNEKNFRKKLKKLAEDYEENPEKYNKKKGK